jgi:phage tail-like protein
MADQLETYPFVGFHFKVEFHDVETRTDLTIHKASFQEVSGLSAQIGSEEVKEGGENTYAHRLPQPTKYGNLVLKRGMLEDDALVEWIRDAIENFSFSTKLVFVKLLNEKGLPVQSWTLTQCYPVKWSLSGFNATQSALVVESIELAYKKFTITKKDKTTA